ncbi:hypothetical protein FO488_00310 [Geobacter sp. FeAm09]|uniref:hypothetical protein n=1 Tax=Geobacter sp. FeAm09 TaxID=2597769 RepID=UPI0011ECFFCC|nr:hypothetical protein [Geobacter sp. FeAm09]QEM66749.1 hypothetical protein FO488_00310 [Geobacter sp. FeAm09]
MPRENLMFCGRHKGRIILGHKCGIPCPAAEQDRKAQAAHYDQLRQQTLQSLAEKGVTEPNPEEIFYAALGDGPKEADAFAVAAQVLPMNLAILPENEGEVDVL